MLCGNNKTVKYAYPSYPWEIDERGYYIPDAIIEEFSNEAKKALKSAVECTNNWEKLLKLYEESVIVDSNSNITWNESCALVLDAFYSFNNELGSVAEEVLNDKNRFILNHVSPGKARGICHPACCETNDKEYAIIIFDYDQTINDGVYLAHELGHLISDDYLQKNGATFKDAKEHLAEIQAFFTQHILYGYLGKSPGHKFSHLSQHHFAMEIGKSIINIPIGIGSLLLENALHLDSDDSEALTKFKSLMQSWMGRAWGVFDERMRLTKNVTAANYRDDCISELHKHSMASLISLGLYQKVRSETNTKHITDTLLEKDMNNNDITSILNSFDISTTDELRLFAKRSINYAIDQLLGDEVAINKYIQNSYFVRRPKIY